MSENTTQLNAENIEIDDLKYMNLTDVVRSCCLQDVDWETMKKEVKQVYFSNLLLLKNADVQTNMSVCDTNTFNECCASDIVSQMMIEPSLSPLVIAMESHDDELVNMVLAHYGKVAILDDSSVLSEAICDRYLDNILNYIDENSEEIKPFLFSAFEQVCQDTTKDKEWVALEGMKIISLFPNADKYTDKSGRCFLSLAVKNKQLPLCLNLLEQGHSPIAYADQYFTETVFDIACYQKATHPKDGICHAIVDALREKIPSHQLSYWNEKECHHERIAAQSKRFNMMLIGAMVALAAAAVWFGIKVKDSVQKLNEERLEKSIKKHDNPIDMNVVIMRENCMYQA
ncbi:MAG: hypothetical protein IJY58_05055 [Alphaproteobacteria bacterium]|nr:hypothetical protein [Alphaproteobacteria bacterium]